MRILVLSILVFLELHANNLKYQKICIDGYEYLTTYIVKSNIMDNPIQASTLQIRENTDFKKTLFKKCNYTGVKPIK